MRITIVNGPNLNLLGTREPEIYGDETFDEVLTQLKNNYPDIDLDYKQSNVEGELVNYIQDAGFDGNGIVLNAGAYTHTSVAIGDAVSAISKPVVEVHISNVYAREEFRHKSFISPHAAGIIVGMGLRGYDLAIDFLKNLPS
jgi:3-dehydroquinate dehydratase-2